ncbi:hypothetical protein [Streptomyces goshikiensis]|uniref:hypothetical protein n=1 Tax=Streptomyces goshikiensis TaxID=1942 RepID=UPI00364D8C3F
MGTLAEEDRLTGLADRRRTGSSAALAVELDRGIGLGDHSPNQRHGPPHRGAPRPDDGLKSLYRDVYKRPDSLSAGLIEHKAAMLDRIASEEGRPEAAVQAEEAFALAASYRPMLDGKPPALTGRPNTGTGVPLPNVPPPGSSTRATAA